MRSYRSKNNKNKIPDEVSIQLNILENGRFATILFMIGCFLNFIEYNYSEKAIFQSISSIEEYNSMALDNEIKSATIAEAVSIIFLIAIFIFANNALITFILQLNNLASDPHDNGSDVQTVNKSNNKGSMIIAFFALIKLLGYFGSAIGYHLYLKELEESKL